LPNGRASDRNDPEPAEVDSSEEVVLTTQISSADVPMLKALAIKITSFLLLISSVANV